MSDESEEKMAVISQVSVIDNKSILASFSINGLIEVINCLQS